MQIIVVGCGKVGSRFAQLMSEEGHDIVVVDNDSENFKRLGSSFRGLTVTGVPIDEDVLKQAGIETADGFAAVTPDDNVNMIACQIAKEIFKVPRIFARIQDPIREQAFFQFGVYTLCLTNIAVEEFRKLMIGEYSNTACHIDNNIIDFEYQKISEDQVGMWLNEYQVSLDTMALGVLRDGELLLNNQTLVLQADDEIVLVRKI